MSFSESGYRPEPKNREKLGTQFAEANSILDQGEQLLVPPSREVSAIFDMSVEDIKQKYARRYEIYVRLLRESKKPDSGDNLAALNQDQFEEMKKWLVALNSLDTYIENHRTGKEKVLRGKQVTIFEDLRNFLEAGGTDGYVKLPTGFGKTVLFVELIEALNLRTLIAVPTTQLIDQTEESFQDFAEDLEVGKIYQMAKEFGRQVTIITYQSLISKVESGEINPDDFDCLILDEAHKALGPKTMVAIKKFEKAVKLGFTATPDYSEEKGVSALLETEIHRMTIREGVESNHLCSFRNILIRTKADISKVRVKGAELDDRELSKAVNIKSRNEIALKIYQARFEGKWAVGYCVDIEHAKAITQMFQEAGVPAEAVHGKMTHKQRKEIFDRYKSGETKILFNADLLIAGFNEPRAEACFNLRPIRSAVNVEQRGGRVLRRDKKNPKKVAHIFDFIDEGTDESGIVTFAKVADGSFVLNTDNGWGKPNNGGQGTGPDEAPIDFGIDGVEVVYDEDEILRIQQKMDEAEKDTKRVDGRTIESAITELEAAYAVWKNYSKKDHRKFNRRWLEDNGYGGLCQWADKNTKLGSIVEQCSKELQKDFERKLTQRTENDCLTDLEAAHSVWKGKPQESRGAFNVAWLSSNGYAGVYLWTRENKNIEHLIMKCSEELQKNFELPRAERTMNSALAELEEAYLKWKSLPVEERGKFNTKWLRSNGYSNLYEWTKREGNVTLEDLVAKASQELQTDFIMQVESRTTESALAELEEAYLKWKSLPVEERGKFNVKWLEKGGYNNLYVWTKREGNVTLEDLVGRASLELKADFEKREKYTPESALVKLNEAYLAWKALPEDERGKFGPEWLSRAYSGLYRWIRKNSSLEDLLSGSPHELQVDFKRRR